MHAPSDLEARLEAARQNPQNLGEMADADVLAKYGDRKSVVLR